MKKLFLLFISIIIVSGCVLKNNNHETNEQTTDGETVNLNIWKSETLDIDSVSINGIIKVIDYKVRLIKEFGMPNKMLPLALSEQLPIILEKTATSSSYRMIYSNQTYDCIEDKIILSKIMFSDSSIFLKTPKVELNKDTSIRDISILYPESCKLVLLGGGNAWSGHIELRVSKIAAFEDLRWFLFFKNESLVSVELHRFF